MFDRAFEVSEYGARVPFTAAGLEVTAVPVEHYDIQAFGFRVKGDRVLAYSGDSGPCEALAELARDADLLLSEATLENGGYDGPERGHLSPKEAAEAATDARASGSSSPTGRSSARRRPGSSWRTTGSSSSSRGRRSSPRDAATPRGPARRDASGRARRRSGSAARAARV